MSYNSVPGEPAFLANKRATGKSATSIQQSLSDCCYSSSNLIIIRQFAGIIGLYFTVKFINDDPLYDYGEHLLTLRFYRQLIYIIVVFPLIVLVPLSNAVSACISAGSRPSLGQPSLIAKIAYQAFVALLAFVALIFVAPSIKYSSLVKQIDFEFKRHMKFRYEKDFSYVFLDRIQRDYDCCDEDWYRANYNDKIPLSCYTDDLEFSHLHDQTCPEALGAIVSTRCSIIAACLVAIIVALAILVALDVLRLISAKENYDVRAREQALIAGASSDRSPSPLGSATRAKVIASTPSNDQNQDDDDDSDDGGFKRRILLQQLQQQQQQQQQQQKQQQTDHLVNRLRSEERRHERPLLASGRVTPLAEPEPDLDGLMGPSAGACSPPAILTKANYISRPAESRPKSPVFVGARSRSSSPNSSPAPPRGVLKKTSSLSRSIDRESLGVRDNDDDNEGNQQAEFEAYQRQLQQSLQNQRPLFNVRFAE